MFNYFVFDGHDSRDYGVYISGGGTFSSPTRAYENITVPGRDGDLLSTSTRLQNVKLTYPAGIVDSFSANVEALRNLLLSTVGYAILKDSYHPDEYRYAVYKGGLEPDVLSTLDAAEFDIVFECKPQRYLTVGGEAQDVDAWGDTTTETGDVVTFEGEYGTGIKSLVVNIEPVQSGSGDPSPTNVRTISGWQSVKTVRAGKNLLPYPYADTTKTLDGVTFTDNGDGTITLNGTATATVDFTLFMRNVFYLPKGDFVLTCDGFPDGCYIIFGGTGITYTNIFKSLMPFSFANNNRNTPVGYGILRIVSGRTFNNATLKPMIRPVNETDATFAPYAGTTYTTSLGRTAYGGALDVVTGELTVTHEGVDLGTLAWVMNTSGQFVALLSPYGVSDSSGGTVMCSCYMGGNAYGGNVDKVICVYGSSHNVWVKDSSYTDAAAFKTAMSGQTLVYPLATPLTYTLTAQEVQTLLGTNNVYADAGAVTVEYGDDPAQLVNPTLFSARPIIRVYGYGTVQVGAVTITIAQHSLTYIDIDCAMMDCYCGSDNANSYVTFSGNDFPTLPPSVTNISYSGNITQVLVTTNWWRV